MSCKRFRQALTDHACGAALDAGTAAHLAACAACREQLAAGQRHMQELEDRLQQSLAITPSADFSARVSAHVRAAAPPPAVTSRWWMGAAAAAAIAMALYVVPAVKLLSGLPVGDGAPAGAGQTDVTLRRDQAVDEPAPHRRRSAEALVKAEGRAASTVGTETTAIVRRTARPPEPEVLVGPAQARAIARLRELVGSGVMNDPAIAEPLRPSATEELVIPPLTVPEIAVTDVWAEDSPGFDGPPAAH